MGTITSSLEHDFEELFTQRVDIHADCGFADFLEPNEESPHEIKAHLDLAKRGVIVSTGTERSFFDLIFSKNCDGLIVTDINPRVKAYIDFNTLLLRLCKSREEYVELSTAPESLADRTLLITSKLQQSNFTAKMHAYYLKHLNDFATLYYGCQQKWRTNSRFKEAHYHLNEDQFTKLQRYALEGNIISIIADINDLSSLKGRNISVVDISNIYRYSVIDIQGNDFNFEPRIIRSIMPEPGGTYLSYIHENLTEDELREFDELVAKIDATGANSGMWITKHIHHLDSAQHYLDDDIFNDGAGPFYSKQTLMNLREVVDALILEVPNVGFYDMSSFHDRFSKASAQDLQAICNCEAIKKFSKILVQSWMVLSADIYLKFSKTEEWKTQFERTFGFPNSGLHLVLLKLKTSQHYSAFILELGEARLNKLLQRAK